MSEKIKVIKRKELLPERIVRSSFNCVFGCIRSFIQDMIDTFFYFQDYFCGCPARTRKRIQKWRQPKEKNDESFWKNTKKGLVEWRKECCNCNNGKFICCYQTPFDWAAYICALLTFYIYIIAFWISLMLIYMSIGSYMSFKN